MNREIFILITGLGLGFVTGFAVGLSFLEEPEVIIHVVEMPVESEPIIVEINAPPAGPAPNSLDELFSAL